MYLACKNGQDRGGGVVGGGEGGGMGGREEEKLGCHNSLINTTCPERLSPVFRRQIRLILNQVEDWSLFYPRNIGGLVPQTTSFPCLEVGERLCSFRHRIQAVRWP